MVDDTSPAPAEPTAGRKPKTGAAPQPAKTVPSSAVPRVKDAADSNPPITRTYRGRLTTQLTIVLLCSLVGIGLVAGVQAEREADLASLSEAELVQMLDDLGERAERLRVEKAQLEADKRALESSSDRAEQARKQADEQLAVLQVLAGLAPAEGPGVIASISDPDGKISSLVILGAVQELRDAGAEVIQINDQRVVTSTAFTHRNDGIAINGNPVRAPYRIRAIGDPATLATALRIRGGVQSTVESKGGHFDVVEQDTITVDALRSGAESNYAEPVPDDPAASGGS